MALIHTLESQGNILFRYRGQIPVVLFLLAIPVIWVTNYVAMNEVYMQVLKYSGIALAIMGFFVRAYTIGTTPRGTSGRNTKKQVAEELNSTGIYSVLRHPLYLGNYLMWIGIVFYSYNIWFVLVVTLAYWLYYERIMFAEERFLERKFGETYIEWSKRVPAFIPALKKFRKSSIPFSLKSVLRREYSGVLATVIGFVYVEVLRNYFYRGEFQASKLSFYLLAGFLVVALILRTLKHHTKVLHEEGRS